MEARSVTGALVVALCLLTGCDEVKNVTDQAGRDAARSVVAEVIAIHRPDVPKERLAANIDCTVINAQAIEVRQLAKAAVAGIDPTTVTTVANILQRPGTVECIRLAAPTGPSIS